MTAAGMTAVNPLTHANPMANGAGAGNSGTAATVSANDFLTLLVTEMKNQDPTAQTDPNAYVNQLVQVNSLEQLIQINENLSTALGDGAGAKASTYGTSSHAPGKMGGATDTSVARGQKGTGGVSSPIPVSANPISAFAGNLAVPRSNPAAHRVAQALNGHK
jgi:flagellar basal-body rod modification protein FlgD